MFQVQSEYLKLRCEQLEGLVNGPRETSYKDDDIEMELGTSLDSSLAREPRPEDLLIPNVGITPRSEPVLQRPENEGTGLNRSLFLSNEAVARIAAARDDDSAHREREFRSAQRHYTTTGERPRKSETDRRCMAALINVNGLEAYALLDLGSTTISVTHDFARVAKLKVMQLENPVALQLGTVGSRSMINFGAKTRIELGPIQEDDAYLDVVNIDRYDMIVGTTFMRTHSFVLDFARDELSTRGQLIPTLTAGQEDLMVAKRRASRTRTPATADTRPPVRVNH